MRTMMWTSKLVVLSMVLLFASREIRVEAGSDATYSPQLTSEGPACVAPPEPNDPSPANGATNVPVDTQLSWKVPARKGCARFRLLASTGGLDLNANPFCLVELMTDPVKEVGLGYIGFLPSLDFSPTGVLYGLSLSSLKTINPGVGVRPVCGRVRTLAGETLLLNGIAFHPDGTLYAVGDDNYREIVFYTIDTGTCIATEKCRIPSTHGFIWGIDFSPAGVLYGAFSNLLRIDLVAGQASRVGPRFSLPWVTDLDWAPDGFLYGTDEEERMLYKIDPATGFVAKAYGPYDSEPWGVASQCLDGLLTTVSTQATGSHGTGDRSSQAWDTVPGGESHLVQEAEELLLAVERKLAFHAKRRFTLESLASPGMDDVAQEPTRLTPSQGQEPALHAAAQAGPGIICDVYLDTVNPPIRLACQNVLPSTAADVWTCNPGILRPDMTYYWRVVARNDCGATSVSSIWSFRTKGPIFQDTFPSATIDPVKWPIVKGATVDDKGLGEPSDPYALRLNGYPSGGDAVESGVIDLSGYSKVILSYCYQRGGGGEPPESEDDLIVECYTGVAWVQVARHLGSGEKMTSFECVTVNLPADLLTSNFRLRIRSVGTMDMEAVYDDWFVDDITLYAD